MKKLATILLLFIFLSANTEFGELFRLPLLVQHYFEHRNEDAKISFAEFIEKHYNEANNHASSNTEHQKLPFKSHEAGCSQTIFVDQIFASFNFQQKIEVETKLEIIATSDFHNSPHLSRIWQPPKHS